MISFLNKYIMLPVLPVAVVLFGFYFLLRSRLFLPKRLNAGIRSLFSKNTNDGVSPIAALTVALAGTLGVGNIAGVSVAITLGGAGAVFWMWTGAFFSMWIKYAEVVLAVRYRRCEDGKNIGGPMYYILHGLGSKRLSVLFCIFCIASSLGSGCVIQSNSASSALYMQYGIPPYVTGCVLGILCGVIVLGGVGAISRFTMKTVPVVSFLFLFISLFIIFTNIPDAIRAFGEIFSSAFGIKSISGGVTGAVVAQSIKQGMVKGSLSHEAGAGTSPISHAASNTKSPVEQGFLGIFEVFADTIVMCTVTALVVLIARDKASFSDPYNGMAVTQSSYGVFLGEAAHHMIAASTLFFAFAALICWSYYGICCVEYLTDDKRFSSLYLVLYCIFIAVGAVIRPEFMWELTDFFTCALIFINVPVLFSLRGEVIAETEKYFLER